MQTTAAIRGSRFRPLQLVPPARETAESGRAWAYRALRRNLILLRLEPGRAVSEAEVAAAFRLSRTPVREAFIRLVEDGLLDVVPQTGTFVARIDRDRAEEARFLRSVLEKAVLRLACAAFPPTLRIELEANLAQQRLCRKGNQYDRLLELDDAFHRILYRSVGKERLWRHLKKFDGDLDRLRALQLADAVHWSTVLEEHARIARMVGGGKTAGIDILVDRHLTGEIHERLVARHPDYFKH
jgi:DNA-binding GntR family transcriptional regulator